MSNDLLVVPWRCPICRQGQCHSEGTMRLVCRQCGIIFPVREGIPCFFGDDASMFYEEKGERYHFAKAVPKPSWITRLAMVFADDDFSTNFHLLRRMLCHHGTILDVGCGGGNSFYTTIGPTVGVDLAYSSLRRAQNVYPQVAQASINRLPFPDDTFDFVVSTDVLEHLLPLHKDEALSEMARVLRPGGRMVHLFPVDNRHLLTRWAKQSPELYQRYFVDQDGHDGLETARAVAERLQRRGLFLVSLSVRKGVIWSKWEVMKRFDNEYARKAWWLAVLVRLARWLGGSKWRNHAGNLPLWMLDQALTPWFGLDYVYRVGICLEKPYA